MLDRQCHAGCYTVGVVQEKTDVMTKSLIESLEI